MEDKIIEISDGKLMLNLKDIGIISRDEFREICSFLKNGASYQRFSKFEIDFQGTLFEISSLTEKLIEKSYLFRNKNMQVVLNLGSYNWENRNRCLHYLKKHDISKYQINYFEK